MEARRLLGDAEAAIAPTVFVVDGVLNQQRLSPPPNAVRRSRAECIEKEKIYWKKFEEDKRKGTKQDPEDDQVRRRIVSPNLLATKTHGVVRMGATSVCAGLNVDTA